MNLSNSKVRAGRDRLCKGWIWGFPEIPFIRWGWVVCYETTEFIGNDKLI